LKTLFPSGKSNLYGVFMQQNKSWQYVGLTVLATALLAAGCSTKKVTDPVQAAASEAAQTVTDAVTPVERPSKREGELVVVTAKVKKIDKKNRVVTLQFPDGKETKVKCGPEVRNFAQIRVGDDVKAQFLETAEIFVTGADKPSAKSVSDSKRAALGSKPGAAAIEAVEVKATVVSIDYKTREVTLKGPEDKLITSKVGPEVKRFNEVKQGDTVVVRLTRAASIEVTKPVK
jgi:hypothetical protein